MTEDISPELAKKTLDLTNSILDMIAAEQQRPLTVGTPALQGHCKVHPGAPFPLRATKAGAQEDLASHMNKPGSHHVTLEEIPDWHLGLPDDVIALMTAPPDTQLKQPRSRSIVENRCVAEPANPESTPTESEAS